MNSLRVVFMGTPDFAVPTLQALIDGPNEVVGVFCQPDKQKGRGKKVQMPPVKECALAADVAVYQPNTLRDEAAQNLLESLAPDIIVVVAYGKILRHGSFVCQNSVVSMCMRLCYLNIAERHRFIGPF